MLTNTSFPDQLTVFFFSLAIIPCQHVASVRRTHGFYEHFMPRATTSAHGCELQVNDLWLAESSSHEISWKISEMNFLPRHRQSFLEWFVCAWTGVPSWGFRARSQSWRWKCDSDSNLTQTSRADLSQHAISFKWSKLSVYVSSLTFFWESQNLKTAPVHKLPARKE